MSDFCKKCGKCCANILLVSFQEINTIKKYIKKNNILANNKQSIMIPYQDICPFLTVDKQCSIYEVRPAICKRYQCYATPEYDLDYRDLRAINMLKTFYPKEYCPEIDLSAINNDIKTYNKIIYDI